MTTPAPLMAELMYLNYVSHKNKIWQVNDIYGAIGLITVLPDGNGEGLGRRSIHDFEPIPLTEQWLKEFGFIEDSTVTWNKQITLLFHDNHTFKFYYGEDCVYIKYVHQLQNLYFCLCGTKLEGGGV